MVVTSFPRLPLTTTFTRPDVCSGIFLTGGLFAVDPWSSCVPSPFPKAATDYFSPGIACPAGYYTACHDTSGVKTITTATCCPIIGDVSLSCVDPLTLKGVFSTFFCTWVAPSPTSLSVTVSSDGTTSTSLIKFQSPGGLNAFGYRMVQESSDFTTTSPHATTGPSSTDGTTTSGSSSTTGATSTPPPSSSGISTGAKAAIGVIIPLVVLGILAALFFWWRKRRQDYNAVATTTSPTGDNKAPPLYGGNLSNQTYELNTAQPELMGDVPSSVPPVELPATSRT